MTADEWDRMMHLHHVMHTARDPDERKAAHREWLSTLIARTQADHAERQRAHDARMRQQ